MGTEPYVVDRVCLGLAALTTVAQTNEIFQIVQLVLTCLCLVTTLAYRIWRWYVKAKEDGRITPEELDEGITIAADGLKDIAAAAAKSKDTTDCAHDTEDEGDS